MKLILARSWGHEKVIFQIPPGFSRNTTPGITGLFAQVPTGWLEAPGGQEKEGPVECSLSTNKQSKINNQEKEKQRKREEHKRDWLNKERTKGNQESRERKENKLEENTENLFKAKLLYPYSPRRPRSVTAQSFALLERTFVLCAGCTRTHVQIILKLCKLHKKSVKFVWHFTFVRPSRLHFKPQNICSKCPKNGTCTKNGTVKKCTKNGTHQGFLTDWTKVQIVNKMLILT